MSNQARGHKAKKSGAQFEVAFAFMCGAKRVRCTRIPDSGRRLSGTLFVQVKSPFDFVVSNSFRTALIDTKSVDSATFPASKINTNQLYELLKHPASGYVVNLRKINKVVFFRSTTLAGYANTKGSLDYSVGVLLGELQDFDPNLILEN